MLGGGLIAIAVDEGFGRRLPQIYKRVAVTSALATPLVTLFVAAIQHLLFGEHRWSIYLPLLWQVWPIMLAAMAVRALISCRSPTKIETRTIVAPPLPEAETAFQRRLSARRRGAKLIAVEAHDHYLRVHTDVGAELITLRFADELDELAQAHGWRVQRSWWVAADAIEAARAPWRRRDKPFREPQGSCQPDLQRPAQKGRMVLAFYQLAQSGAFLPWPVRVRSWARLSSSDGARVDTLR